MKQPESGCSRKPVRLNLEVLQNLTGKEEQEEEEDLKPSSSDKRTADYYILHCPS